MLIVSGKGVVSTDADAFPHAQIIAADEARAARVTSGALDAALHEATKGGPAIVWIDEHESITAIPLDDARRCARDTPLASHGGLSIAAGTQADDVVIEGDAAGQLRVRLSAAGNEPWICYFFPGRAPQTWDGFRFRVFQSSASASFELHASIDPSRPRDASRNSMRVAAAAPIATNFTTPNGKTLSIATTKSSTLKTAHDPGGAPYLVLNGEWTLTGQTGPGPGREVLLGLSGSEYANLDPSWNAHFVADSPAFAPSFGQAGGDSFPLTFGNDPKNPVTTSWVYFAQQSGTGPGGVQSGYFSQPGRAPLFTPVYSATGPQWPYPLQAFPILAADFPNNAQPVYGAPAAGFPMAPFAGIQAPSGPSGGWASSAQMFDSNVLAPARSQAIYAMNSGPTAAPFGAAGATAITPQGMYSQFSKDGSTWQMLRLAGTASQLLALTNITGSLREALLANNLFLVISDPTRLSDFLSNDAQIVINNWTFKLGPNQWVSDAGKPALTQTVMIMKFCPQDFDTAAGNLSLWTMAPTFNGGSANAQNVQKRLLQFIADARIDVATHPDLKYFVNTVLAEGNAGWNGILFLNVPVPPSQFPPQLRGLAAGLPSTGLVAHHLGVNVSPFVAGRQGIDITDSSMFALILYESLADLTPSGNPYDFKVQTLHVLFENSTIAAFSSQLELLVMELFGEAASLTGGEHGNNILFTGLWQKHGASDSYSFTFSGANSFQITSGVLANIVIQSAQFVTLPQSPSAPNATTSQFILDGAIQFVKLDGFDLFSFDALNFSSMYVTMTYDSTPPTPTRTFEFLAGQMIFDSGSIARAGSLYANFPLQLNTMHQIGLLYPPVGASGATGFGPTGSYGPTGPSAAAPVMPYMTTTPADLGFAPVSSPLTQGTLGPVWFGIEMDFNLGSPGALAPKLPFNASVLASWAPSGDVANVSIGLRLPDTGGGNNAFALEGPLRLNVNGLEFFNNDNAFVLRLDNITLQFLSLKFPPGGQANALLFGDPNPAAGSRSLGWYVAYKKDE